MSSSLTFQLQNQQRDSKGKPTIPSVSLPSPPSSSCGDDGLLNNSSGPPHGTGTMLSAASSVKDEAFVNLRRDSLPTHFSALTLQAFSTSLPENYTIDHSSPIPIQSLRRPSSHSPRPESPLHGSPLSSATAAAAATGGRTIRHRRPSEQTTLATRKSRVISESPSKMIHRCEDCGKMYKHPSCLAKHRWEHSDEWELTSKLLLTKHQQVQMLEAAAILVSMDGSRKSPHPVPPRRQPPHELDDPDILLPSDEEDEEEEEDEDDEEHQYQSPSHDTVDKDDNDDDEIQIDMDQDDLEHTYSPFPLLSSKSSTLPATFTPHN
ncbi:uncharacterized protein BYT42DRAFT_606851 [Radiomyces spectabilis]|uniref:uncharacterized protein n=1 Tax=Radiomyces spectabilis TaxID=64574 RepID=UPI00221E884C|nr:uncharacterized protein BYT42DRAFT_606851 [Radiomyces spectabilis]KAI8373028.1 hypothetical protein BYT42DRAFT_606851 [Radiomyces spectabilis]